MCFTSHDLFLWLTTVRYWYLRGAVSDRMLADYPPFPSEHIPSFFAFLFAVFCPQADEKNGPVSDYVSGVPPSHQKLVAD